VLQCEMVVGRMTAGGRRLHTTEQLKHLTPSHSALKYFRSRIQQAHGGLFWPTVKSSLWHDVSSGCRRRRLQRAYCG